MTAPWWCMSEDRNDAEQGVEQDGTGHDRPGRKERAAARRAEFEEMKAARAAEKAAAKEAKREAKREAKEAARLAVEKVDDASAEQPGQQSGEGPRREKDPYRPRFAVAPGRVRAFAMVSWVLSALYAGAGSLLAADARSGAVGLVDSSSTAGALAALALLAALVLVASSWLLCAGRLAGKRLAFVALVLALPLSLPLAPLLLSGDVDDWAL